MAGWIKIHRDIQRHWIAQDMLKFGWWVDMLLLASYEDSRVLVKNQIADLKRGQFVGSLAFLAKRWGVSRDRVSSFLKLLESDGMIKRHLEGHIQQITICNYEGYQDVPDSLPTDSRQYADSLPTDCQPNKEIKEDKEINNNLSSAHAREENAPWEEARERGFAESFKGYGAALPLSKVVGKTPVEVMTLLDVYMAHRQLTGLGHKDYRHFVEAFKQAIKNNKICMPAKEETKQSRVVTGADVLKLYG